MSEPTLLNFYKDEIPEDAVHIGRSTPFGNPFRITPDRNREQAVKLFEEWVIYQPQLIALIKQELKGKDLVCYCAPKSCHGEIVLRIANAKE